MISFGAAVLRVGGGLLLAGGAGYLLSEAMVPRGRAARAERLGWTFALATALLALAAAVSLAVPRLSAVLVLVFAVCIAALLSRRAAMPPDTELPLRVRPPWRPVEAALLAAAVVGVALYALRALAEPLWAGDFLAIWGLKGKALFEAGGVPAHLLEDPRFGFTHPEYPLGLPLLYAGAALAAGVWDDQALALLFPCWLAATMLVAFGWLRRRGAPVALSLGAAVLVSHFAPLYSAFLAGMAEVPMAFAFLLLGTSFVDALDGEGRAGALRRLAFASFLAAGTKNEGLFMVGLALLLLLALRGLGRAGRGAGRTALALAVPALATVAAHRLALGAHPVRDFDLSYLLRPGLMDRAGEAASALASVYLAPRWPALLLLAGLLALGRRVPAGDRLLLLAGGNLLAYLALPLVSVLGPSWLVTWSLGRTAAALGPMVAVAAALRLAPLFEGLLPVNPADPQQIVERSGEVPGQRHF